LFKEKVLGKKPFFTKHIIRIYEFCCMAFFVKEVGL